MRKVFLLPFLFLLLAQIATAQKTVLSDTSFITNNAGKFFETKETIYSNGESERATNLIGDTSQVLTMYANAANVETKQFAACVAVVNGRNKQSKKFRGYLIPAMRQLEKQSGLTCSRLTNRFGLIHRQPKTSL